MGVALVSGVSDQLPRSRFNVVGSRRGGRPHDVVPAGAGLRRDAGTKDQAAFAALHRLALSHQHLSLPQLGDDLLRIVMLARHPNSFRVATEVSFPAATLLGGKSNTLKNRTPRPELNVEDIRRLRP